MSNTGDEREVGKEIKKKEEVSLPGLDTLKKFLGLGGVKPTSEKEKECCGGNKKSAVMEGIDPGKGGGQ